MEKQRIKIVGGQIITPQRIISGGTLILGDGIITAVAEGGLETPADRIIEADGHFVSPGFIDLHVHGGGGHDFMDGTLEAFRGIAEMHLAHGTTTMYPTTLTCPQEELLHTISVFELSRDHDRGAQLMGLHLEGPYIAQSQRGAQDPRYIRNPDPSEYEEVLRSSGFIRRWSAAPELPGALALGEYLRASGILPSVAHTDATYEEVKLAYRHGYTHITHLYSAMSGISRKNGFRTAGVIESAYLIDEMTVEIIADGVHLPEALLKLVYKFKGADKTALITDSMRAAGMPPGKSQLGGIRNGVPVIVEDGVAKLPDRSFFAGSVATADRLVRNMVSLAGAPIQDAVRMITLTPARIMGIADRKGSIETGKDADILLFDKDIRIGMAIVRGEIRYDHMSPESTAQVMTHG